MEEIFLGKSLGTGVYNTRGFIIKVEIYPSKFERILINLKLIRPRFLPNEKEFINGNSALLDEAYDFIWKHMTECHKDEFKSGELFKIVSD